MKGEINRDWYCAFGRNKNKQKDICHVYIRETKMIDIPLGKDLVPVERDYHFNKCVGCFFENGNISCNVICCNHGEREDDKNVIFKLVDYPVEEKK